jgi:hypothetical protein
VPPPFARSRRAPARGPEKLSGEHPDWDDYRAAMVRQGKSLIRIEITGWGPIATGGFPPEVVDKL